MISTKGAGKEGWAIAMWDVACGQKFSVQLVIVPFGSAAKNGDGEVEVIEKEEEKTGDEDMEERVDGEGNKGNRGKTRWSKMRWRRTGMRRMKM